MFSTSKSPCEEFKTQRGDVSLQKSFFSCQHSSESTVNRFHTEQIAKFNSLFFKEEPYYHDTETQGHSIPETSQLPKIKEEADHQHLKNSSKDLTIIANKENMSLLSERSIKLNHDDRKVRKGDLSIFGHGNQTEAQKGQDELSDFMEFKLQMQNQKMMIKEYITQIDREREKLFEDRAMLLKEIGLLDEGIEGLDKVILEKVTEGYLKKSGEESWEDYR